MITAALLASILAFGPDTGPRPARLVLQPGSTLTIEGTSNLHDWSCTTSAIQADVRLQVEESNGQPQAVESVSIAIPVARIQCKNDRMDENLRKALRAEDHATITFRTTGPAAVRTDAAGRTTGTVRGALTVAGVTKTVDVPVQAVSTPGGGLRISGQKPFLMTQFGIDPPTAMLGVLKTANRVTVRFDLIAAAAELGANPAHSPAAR